MAEKKKTAEKEDTSKKTEIAITKKKPSAISKTKKKPYALAPTVPSDLYEAFDDTLKDSEGILKTSFFHSGYIVYFYFFR